MNIIFLLVMVFAGLTACNKDQTTQPASVSDLPLKATTYIDNNYPDATVTYVVMMDNSTAKYIVTLNTTEELAFTEVGEFLGDGRNYHGNHHGGDTICGDSTHNGHHGGRHRGHHGGPHGQGIPVDSLPTDITEFITANYSGFSIRHAEIDTLCIEGVVFEVMVGNQGLDPAKLVFDLSGNFLFKGNRIRYEDTPQAVKDYVTTNFPSWEVCHRGELYTMPDSTLQYTIYLKQADSRKFLRLQADGTLVCER
jgi:hypothetical protein